jgi:hypothetical protein
MLPPGVSGVVPISEMTGDDQEDTHLQHEDWVRNRKEPTPEFAAWALKLLERPRKNPIEPGDELPEGYRRKK